MRSIYPSHISGTITDTRMSDASIFDVTSRMAHFARFEDPSMQLLVHHVLTYVVEQCIRDGFGYHATTVALLALDCMDGHIPWAQLEAFFERGIDMHTIAYANVRETFEHAEQAREFVALVLTLEPSSSAAAAMTYVVDGFAHAISLSHEYEAQRLCSTALAFLDHHIDATRLQQWLRLCVRCRSSPLHDHPRPTG